MITVVFAKRFDARQDAVEQRLEELVAALQGLGYAREEVLALCGLGDARPRPSQLHAAVDLLEQQLEFARKCVAVVQK